MKSIIVVVSALLLSACQQMNDSMKSFNSGLSDINSVLSGKSAVLTDSASAESVSLAIKNAVPPKDVRSLFDGAVDDLSRFLNAASCGKDLKIYQDVKEVYLSEPLLNMREHNTRLGCLRVYRVDGIEKITAITFKFRVVFVSPQSEETSTRKYVAVRQPSGDFLFRTAY